MAGRSRRARFVVDSWCCCVPARTLQHGHAAEPSGCIGGARRHRVDCVAPMQLAHLRQRPRLLRTSLLGWFLPEPCSGPVGVALMAAHSPIEGRGPPSRGHAPVDLRLASFYSANLSSEAGARRAALLRARETRESRVPPRGRRGDDAGVSRCAYSCFGEIHARRLRAGRRIRAGPAICMRETAALTSSYRSQ